MVKRLGLLAVPAVLVLGLMAMATPASATVVFQLTVNPKAVLNADRTIATVSGTYLCSGGFEFSGVDFGFQVTQIQGKGRVVTGGGGTGGDDGGFFLNCDGQTHDWSIDVPANDANGQPATWKNGKATFTGGGGGCDADNCNFVNVQQVLHLS